jgi:hypothetical protein
MILKLHNNDTESNDHSRHGHPRPPRRAGAGGRTGATHGPAKAPSPVWNNNPNKETPVCLGKSRNIYMICQCSDLDMFHARILKHNCTGRGGCSVMLADPSIAVTEPNPIDTTLCPKVCPVSIALTPTSSSEIMRLLLVGCVSELDQQTPAANGAGEGPGKVGSGGGERSGVVEPSSRCHHIRPRLLLLFPAEFFSFPAASSRSERGSGPE